MPAIGALTTGCLLLLSYPPFDLSWIAWFALAPLMAAWQATRRYGVLTAATILSGAIWGGGLFFPLLAVDGGGLLERLAGFLLTTGTVSLFLTLFACGVARLAVQNLPGWARILCASALWVVMEYALRLGAVGFSVYLGVTQWPNPAVLGVASIGGIHAVSGLILVTNALVAQAVLALVASTRGAQREHSRTVSPNRRMGAAWLAVGAAAIGISISQHGSEWTSLLLERSQAAETARSGAASTGSGAPRPTLTLMLVQPGFTPEDYDLAAASLADQLALLHRVIAVTDESLRTMADVPAGGDPVPTLIVWPETTLHVPLTPYASLREPVEAMLSRHGAYLLAGFPRPYWEPPGVEAPAEAEPGARLTAAPTDRRERNAAYLFRPDGAVRSVYDKVNVIPIAEARYAAGNEVRPFSIAIEGAAIPLGVGICSDAVEPRHARDAVRAGAKSLHYLASLSRIGPLARLERAFLSFRAVEHGVYVTQTATTGPTIVIDPQGAVVQWMPESEPGALVVRLPVRAGETLYTRLGDWPAGLAGVTLLFMGALSLVGGRGRGRAAGARRSRRSGKRSPGVWMTLATAASLGCALAASVGMGKVEAASQLRVWISGGTPGLVSVLQRGGESAVARFEREEGVRVEIVGIDWRDSLERYLAAAAAGSAPDVVLVSAESLPLLAGEGVIAALDGRLQAWSDWETYYPAAKESVAWEGRSYGVPAHASVKTFLYHETPFIRYGVDRRALPQTWTGYRNVVERLTVVQEDRVDSRGTVTPWIGEWKTWLGMLWQAGGSLFDDDGAPQFTGEQGVRALRYLADLYGLAELPGDAGGGASLEIATGRVASLLGDAGILRMAKAYRPIQSDFLRVGPPIGQEMVHVVVESDAWVVGAQAKEPDLAFRFIQAISRPEIAARFAAAAGRLPVRRDAAGFLPLVEGGADLLPFVEALEKHGRALPGVDFSGTLAGLLQGAVHRAVTGMALPEQALAGAAAMWDTVRRAAAAELK